jgi:histidinol-phosphate phosphatase family protein
MISNLETRVSSGDKKLLVLDRDGTLIDNFPYLKDKSLIKFKPGVLEGLLSAQSKDFEFVVATNQSGIGRKLVTIEDVNAIHKEISMQLLLEGIKLDEFIFCPHIPDYGCECRKPNNAMIEEIIKIKKIDRNKVFLIGDMLTDAQAAAKSGIRSYIVNNSDVAVNKIPDKSQLVTEFRKAISLILD